MRILSRLRHHNADSAFQSDPDEAAVGSDPDDPIDRLIDDKLNRAAFAQAFAHSLTSGDRKSGFAVGLVGPWGSGKTSILNMAVDELRRDDSCLVIPFNPWLFSGTEQLVGNFFHEMGAQLKEEKDGRLRVLATQMTEYGAVLKNLGIVPMVGDVLKVVGGVSEAANRALKPAGESLTVKRDRIATLLRDLDRRLVVIIDDIDRLRQSEILDVMRLVRLTGHFPNVVYALSFDRGRVEAALAEDFDRNPNTGRAYLEKILQVIHEVPQMRLDTLYTILTDQLMATVKQVNHGPVDEAYHQNILRLVIRPLFTTVRDVRRFVNTIPMTLQLIGDEIALPDVLALEALRILVPDAFSALPDAVAAMWQAQGSLSGYDNAQAQAEAAKTAFERVLEEAGAHADAVKQLCLRVFPGSGNFFGRGVISYGSEWLGHWRRERRVAFPEVFRVYLEKSLPPGVLAASDVENIFRSLGDDTELERLLEAMSADLQPQLFGRLEAYEDEFPENLSSESLAVFLNAASRTGYGTWADLPLSRLILRLLRRVRDEANRRDVADGALAQSTSLSGKLVLIRVIGHRKNVGHGLVDTVAAGRMERELAMEVVQSSIEKLAQEPLLSLLVQFVLEIQPEAIGRLSGILDNDAALIRLLASSLGTISGGPIGDLQWSQHTLAWDWLGKVFGEDWLRDKVNALLELPSTDDASSGEVEAMALAGRYIEGWRPATFPGEPTGGHNVQSDSEGPEHESAAEDGNSERTGPQFATGAVDE